MQTPRRPQDSDSVVGAAPKIRTLGTVIVCDSYVLLFFGEFIKCICTGRGMMQKAKQAQIKRLAELELCVEDDQENRKNESTEYDGGRPLFHTMLRSASQKSVCRVCASQARRFGGLNEWPAQAPGAAFAATQPLILFNTGTILTRGSEMFKPGAGMLLTSSGSMATARPYHCSGVGH